MKKKILVKQRDVTDCGAACLSSIGNHYGLRLPVSRIRQLAGTDKKGTSALGIMEAAEQLGFSAKGVRGDITAIPEIPVPAIAHVIIKEVIHHYMVIYRSSSSKIDVMDPAYGKLVVYTEEEFEKIWSGVLILLTPNEKFEKRNEKVAVNSRFRFLLKPYRSILIQAIIGAAIFTLIGLTNAIYIQKIVDFVFPSQNHNLLNLLSAAMLGLLIVQIPINIFKSIFVLKVGQQLDAKLILGYYQHVLSLPQQFFDSMRVGEIISRINDAVKIRSFLNETGIDILINFFVVLFSFLLMFTYYWKLALVILIMIPLYAVIYFLSNHFNKKVERKVMENTAELESHLIESLQGMRTIKNFGMKEVSNLKAEVRLVDLLTSVYKSGMNNIFSFNGSLTISRCFTIFLLWIGAGYVIDQQITPGELMSFYAILGYFTAPAGSLISANKTYQNARIAADRLFEIIDLETSDDTDKLNLTKQEPGDIQFQDVNFRYGPRNTVFDGLSLIIKKGELTAIAGESGSGKSTIIAILKQLYPVVRGKVLVGNIDLDSISEESLHRWISVVPQEIDLFSGTLLENIAVNEFDPDVQRIIHLAESIGALGFINSLPGGFNCQLGEHGINLSGGQRQRIAILRALYPDPQIILFDEATSALDTKSEGQIIQTMLTLRKLGKTVIAVTHRIGIAEAADRVILLDKGRVKVEGKHKLLYRTNEYYKTFWQSSGSEI